MQHSASSTCSDVNATRVSEAHHHYPVIQQPIQSNGDFRVPGAPPATSQIVSSSTCSPPSSTPGHVIMRPPPPPPPLPLKISRNFASHQDIKPSHITQEEPSSSIPDLGMICDILSCVSFAYIVRNMAPIVARSIRLNL